MEKVLRALLHIFVGEDDYSKHEALKKLKRALGGPAMLESNIAKLDGAKLSEVEFRANTFAAPFLSDKRLVIVEGLLYRFERGGKKGKPKSPSSKEKITSFAGVMRDLPATTELVLQEGKISPANPLLKEITIGSAQKPEVKFFNTLKGDGIARWINARIKARGAAISPGAVALLASQIGGNLWVMDGELKKLAAYVGERTITEEDVKKLVGYMQQASVFSMVDAIVGGKIDAAQRLLNRQLDDGVAPPFLLYMITRQIRLMMLAKDILGKGMGDAECQKRIGVVNEYAYKKVKSQAKRYPLDTLKHMYGKAFEADLGIKTGKTSAELAINILVAELCIVANASSPANV